MPTAQIIPTARWRWGIVWLLFAATLINYTDRLALNNTQRFLLPEFEPDPAKQNKVYAEVLLAFGLAFGLFQLVAGFLVDKLNLRWIYVLAILIWSSAGIATGFVPAGAIGSLILCRFLLGIGEAFNWPAAVATIRRVIPRESRGLANGIFHSGASIGALATPFLVLMLVNTKTGEGWRTLFIIVGALGIVWALVWLRVTAPAERQQAINSPPQEEGSEGNQHTSFFSLFQRKTFWICLAGVVCTNICWHFYNQWFPRYLTQDLRVSARAEQAILAAFFIAADLGSMLSGWSLRQLTRSGLSLERSRKIVATALGMIVLTATIPAAFFLQPDALLAANEVRSMTEAHPVPLVQIGAFLIVAAATMGGFAIVFQFAQDIVGSRTAQILGFVGCVSWLIISGISELIGRFDLAGPGKYGTLFVMVGCCPLAAALLGWLWPEPNNQIIDHAQSHRVEGAKE